MAVPNPNLSSILQTLSSYAPPSQPVPPIAQDDTAEYDPAQFDPALAQALQSYSKPLSPNSSYPFSDDTYSPFPSERPSQPSQLRPSSPKRPPSTKNISTYSAALRHITTHLSPLPHFTSRIRRLIQEQHKHERQWHSGREALLLQLQNRDASRKKLDEVLASVGGRPATPGGGDMMTGALSKEEELKVFDRKVWRAQKEMFAAAEKELARLGVPFFDPESHQKWKEKEEELKCLKVKVLALLEDLCGNDEGEGENNE